MSAFDGLVTLAKQYNDMLEIMSELTEIDPWVSGETSEWCHFCKNQRPHGSKNDHHQFTCLVPRSNLVLMSD